MIYQENWNRLVLRLVTAVMHFYLFVSIIAVILERKGVVGVMYVLAHLEICNPSV